MGATCQNTSTGGSWTRQERMSHINILELKAGFLAFQTFAVRFSNCHILLLIDNTMAIAYINHKGGTHCLALSNLAIKMWEWCLVRNLSIHAEHILGLENVNVDMEFRRSLNPSDWLLNMTTFNQATRSQKGSIRCGPFCGLSQQAVEMLVQFSSRPASRGDTER